VPDAPSLVPDTLILTPTAPVAGGAALARDPDGRVVFVRGALPGERVRARIVGGKRDFSHAAVVEVLEPSPGRITPPCPYVAEGCGGCDLQHLDPPAQPALKRAIVVDALRRQGRIDDPLVTFGPELASQGFRTTVRAAVTDGQAQLGFRAEHSHLVIPVEHCLVAHPLVDELLTAGRYEGCDEVTVRVGAATGERLVIGDPTAAGIDLPDDLDGEGITTAVIGGDQLAAGVRAWFHDEVGGHRFRISARSFFQTRPDGAMALVDAVRAAGGAELRGAMTVVDAYAGVGLFAALATPDDARLIVVEGGASSVADARVNLAGRDVKIIRSKVERWRPSSADVVIADPARAGLGKDGARVLTATAASVIVLVSCDAAALGRDAALLARSGYRYEESQLVDLFPQTHHVEVVSRFTRATVTPP
jgi:23S rRNA (uracil1939-C5)-methyltransferase